MIRVLHDNCNKSMNDLPKTVLFLFVCLFLLDWFLPFPNVELKNPFKPYESTNRLTQIDPGWPCSYHTGGDILYGVF